MTPEEVAQLEEDENMVLTFGKYRNQRLGDLTSKYLNYLSCDAWDKRFMEPADRIWQWREDNNAHVGKYKYWQPEYQRKMGDGRFGD